MKRGKDSGKEVFSRRDFLKISGFCGGALALGEWSHVRPSLAAESYPSKKITWIIGHAPGGGEDMIPRGVAPYIEKYLKMASPNPNKVGILIKNMPGGGTMRSIETLYSAKPDGYTFASGSEIMITKSMLGELGFDLSEITLLGRLSSANKVLVTNNKSDFNTWDDIVNASKKAPVKIGIGGFGASNHVAAILFASTVQLPVRILVFEGTSQVNQLLIRGDFPLAMHSFDSVMNLINLKELRPLLTFSQEIKLPGVPNIKDIGFPQLNDVLSSQRFVMAPPKLPANIKKTLEDAMKKGVVDKEFLEWNKKANLSYAPVFGEEYEKLFKQVISFYKSKEKVLREYLVEQKS